MTASTKQLHPLAVSSLPPKMKGGDLEVKPEDRLWVLRNHSGRYGKEPYEVVAKSEIVHQDYYTYGLLVLVETHVDDYFDCIGNLDIIGTSKEDVISKVNKIVGRIQENKRKRKAALEELFDQDEGAKALIEAFKKQQEESE